MKFRILLLCLWSLFFFSCNKKEETCFAKFDSKNCHDLFDKIQQNLNDQEKLQALRECYDQECR